MQCGDDLSNVESNPVEQKEKPEEEHSLKTDSSNGIVSNFDTSELADSELALMAQDEVNAEEDMQEVCMFTSFQHEMITLPLIVHF